VRASLAEGTLGGARAVRWRGAGAAAMRVAEARVRRIVDFMATEEVCRWDGG
jgi:hypothetical protein